MPTLPVEFLTEQHVSYQEGSAHIFQWCKPGITLVAITAKRRGINICQQFGQF